MRLSIKIFFLFVYLSFLNEAYGQKNLSENSPNSPYSTKQNTWLNDQGFYVLNYGWSNKEVNSKLNHAIFNRTLGKVTLFATIGSFALGGLSYLKSEMADEAKWKNDHHKTFFKVSGGLAVLSIAFPLNARRKVKQAIILRKN
ncbi:MAG: hypothetical protein ABJH98_10410 [Reichenbachiella sp.]|uniref:hypothetical protein n=1 Tax=Reichenbachiella sp. TaxID=2184521 RepID=UPI003299ABFE